MHKKVKEMRHKWGMLIRKIMANAKLNKYKRTEAHNNASKKREQRENGLQSSKSRIMIGK